MTGPSIGRIVHYRNSAGRVCPAIVTAVAIDERDAPAIYFTVNLVVFNEDDRFPQWRFDVSQSDADTEQEGWFWPPRA